MAIVGVEQKNPWEIFLFKIIPIILILIIVWLVLMIPHKTNCDYDLTCFNEAALQCKPALVNIIQEGNTFEYTVDGIEDDNCILSITVTEVNKETSEETIAALEGKSMKCAIPLETNIIEIQENSDIMTYCTGPLKEAMYEIIIQRMYGVIAQNMGSIISEAKEDLI